MIVQDITVLVVKNLKIPFYYKPLLKPYKMYIKDYNIIVPLIIKKDQLKEVKYNSTVNIIIKFKQSYYWCPQFEEIYKSYRGDSYVKEKQKNMFVIRTIMNRDSNNSLTLNFDFRNVQYITKDIKQIKIKDADN